MIGVTQVKAQASYNQDYKVGVTVAAGTDYFLYNIGAGMFLTDGMDWGTHATADHAGRVITFATLAGGKYSIYTASFSVNNGEAAKAGYMTTNGYLDTGSNDANWEFTPVEVAGYTNAYTIKNSDTEYLYFDASDARVQVGPSTGNNYSYWIIVPKSVREAAKDYTYYLMNTDFNRPWERSVWTELASKGNRGGGLASNRCAEFYHKTFDMSQTISASVTSGRYKLYAQAFYRKDGGTDPAYLYANDDKIDLLVFNAHGEGTVDNMDGASTSFNEGKYVNSIETFVDNNSLKVGISNDNGSNWVLFDNFYLEYLGQCVMDYAVALPDGGAMVANTWYYFDIDAAANNYLATSNDLSKIICTDDGYTLTSATSGNITLTATDNVFAVKRYYVKSTTDNNLEISVASYTYELGSITAQSIAEDEYIKGLTTFVVTYGDAATNDPDASLAVIGTPAPVATLKKNGSAIATGALTANNAAKTLTATFSDVSLVLNSNDYSIEIPAGAFGYEGEAENAAITVNFNTPLFADGDFYMKNKENGAYFAGGNGWGTQAITNTIGHKVTLTALSDGKYYINTYLNNGGSNQYLNGLWCDGAATGWTFTASGDDYIISNNTGKLTAGSIGEAMTLTDGTGDNTKWILLTTAAWKAENVARLDAATANNGVDATFYIPAANFNRNDLDNSSWLGDPGIDGLNSGDATCNYNGQKWNTTPFDVYQELADLKPGAYKLTAQGFYRNGTTDDRNAYLYANGFSVSLVNIKSAGVTEQDDARGFTTENSGYYVPNKQDQAAKTFNNNYYNNELWFNVGNDGALRVGVRKSTGAAGDWTVFDKFQLTYYGNEVCSVTLDSETGFSTFASTYALDLTQANLPEGLKAYKATSVDGENITFEALDQAVPANTGVLLAGEAGVTYNIPVAVSGTEVEDNIFKVNTNGIVKESGHSYFALKKGTKEFRPFDPDNVTFPANRAYLDLENNSGARLVIQIDGETAINAIEAAETAAEGLKDGKFIIGNKIVLVKNGVKYSANGQILK